MPRSSRSSARPSAPSSSHSSQQSRGAHTAAYPAQHAPAPAAQHAGVQQQRQPGMLAQAASTMGGAMAGSVVGHGISNMLFGGGGGQQAAPVEQAQAPVNQQQAGMSCDIQAKDFTKCLEATNGDMQSCGYYLEALKACQAAARPY